MRDRVGKLHGLHLRLLLSHRLDLTRSSRKGISKLSKPIKTLHEWEGLVHNTVIQLLDYQGFTVQRHIF